jgi:hypothetical protein
MELFSAHKLIPKRKRVEKLFRSTGKAARVELDRVGREIQDELDRLEKLIEDSSNRRRQTEIEGDVEMERLIEESNTMDRLADIEREDVRRLQTKALDDLHRTFSIIVKIINEKHQLILLDDNHD